MRKNYLCGECYLQGHCRRLTSRIVTNDELTPIFIANVRKHMRAMQLTRDAWAPYLIEGYRDYPGRIVDGNDNEVVLDTAAFDTPAIRYWFRDLCRALPEGATPHLRREARPRFIILATILRALYPIPTMVWGIDVANHVEPKLRPVPPSRQDECPYRHFTITTWGRITPGSIIFE